MRRLLRVLAERWRRRTAPPPPTGPHPPRRRVLLLCPRRPPYLPGHGPPPSRHVHVPEHLAALDRRQPALVRPYVVEHERLLRRRAAAPPAADRPGPLWLYETERPR